MALSCPKTTHTILSIITLSLVFRTDAQISTPCTSSMISTFTPCLNYVTRSSAGGSSPTEDCCNSLKSLMSGSMDCACLIVTGSVPVSIPFVNRNLAISLPRVCKSSVPVQCKASGNPVPAPGPALLGPPAAPSPYSPQVSNAGVKAAPPPVEGEDTEPSSPPESSNGPGSNPGIRPVVNPNSTSKTSTILWPNLVIMSLGIMVLKFL